MKPVRAYLNFLSFLVNRGTARTTVDNYPLVAFVDPALFCNLRCPACPTGAQAGLRPAATLDWNLYRAFIDEIGDYVFKLYLYNLGEPLLHKSAPELVAYARAKDILVMVSSNLSMNLDDEYIDRLVQSDLDVLVVPLDGTSAETYQKYRRRGNFELVRTNMQRIQAAKTRLGSIRPKIIWQFLVFAHNEHELDVMRQHYREWGADEYWIAGAYMPVGAAASEFAPSTMARHNIYQAGHLHPRKTEEALRRPRACSWLYGVAVLNPNGTLSPCCYVPSQQDDFSVYDPSRGFLSAFNDERFVRARRLFAERPGFWQSGDSIDTLVHRTDGRAMGVAATLQSGQLICEKCPVPFLQDVVDIELEFEPSQLLQYIASSTLSEEERAQFERLTRALGQLSS